MEPPLEAEGAIPSALGRCSGGICNSQHNLSHWWQRQCRFGSCSGTDANGNRQTDLNPDAEANPNTSADAQSYACTPLRSASSSTSGSTAHSASSSTSGSTARSATTSALANPIHERN